jgi:TolB-like protein/Tfp pilus assembly protein PilF
MEFRIGINLGDVIEEEGRIYGDGINIAARVESMADAGGICISGRAYDQVANKLGLGYESLGEYQVKNIKTPIRVFRIKKDADLSEGIDSDEQSSLPLPDKPSIAVLPFNNMSGDSEQEYFSDGITEDIITALSRSPWLFVISRNSSFTYRGSAVDVRVVSRELGVRYILEGSVRKVGNRVRITAQLIDGIEGGHVWAEKYDGELQDIFDLQDSITQQVVAAITAKIWSYVGEKAQKLDRPDIGIWDLLAQGNKLFSEFTKESLAAAEKIYRRAITSAPTSCNAHTFLASVLTHQLFMGYISDTTKIASEALELAKRAVSLDENNEYAHFALGNIQGYRGKLDLAIAEFNRAIELNPNSSYAYGSLGDFLSRIDPDKSIKTNEFAIRINPRDPSIFFRFVGIARAHFAAGRYLEASQWARKGVQRKPNYRDGHALLAASLAQANLLEEAKEAVNNYLKNFPDDTISYLQKLWNIEDSDNPGVEGLRKAGLPE